MWPFKNFLLAESLVLSRWKILSSSILLFVYKRIAAEVLLVSRPYIKKFRLALLKVVAAKSRRKLASNIL